MKQTGLPKGQQGYILLPVMLLLSLVAMVAFTLSYEGSIGRYLTQHRTEPEKATYVAEAGLQYASWQVQHANCLNYTDVATTPFGSHSFTAAISPQEGSPVDISASGTLDNGISRTITKQGVKVYSDFITSAFQPGPEAHDTYVTKTNNDTNNGDMADLFLDGVFNENNANLILLNFNLAVIPAGATINSAVLELYAYEVDAAVGGADATVHRMLEPWSETGVTYQTQDGATAWSWPANYEAAPAATSTLIIGNTGWQSWDITGLVEGWAEGEFPNNGLLITGSSGLYWSAFYSSDYSVAGLRPRLTVTYACECGGTEQELILQPGPEGQDGYIVPGTNQNYGGTPTMVVRVDGPRAIMKFAVPSLPAGASVASASLHLNMESLANFNMPGYLDIFRVDHFWNEGTGVSDGITWNTFDGVNNWSSPGGDFNAILEASTPVDPALGWHSWDVTDLITAWAAGSQQNYGLILIGRTYVQNAAFTSSDGSTPELRPKLVINYQCPCGSNCVAASDPTDYYRDEFSLMTCDPAVDYTGSNGSIDWSPWSWTESGTDDEGSCSGDVRLVEDMGSNVIAFNNLNNRKFEREVDIAAFNRAFVSFDYRRQFTGSGESMDVRASPDGGVQWVVLDTITGTGTDTVYKPTCYDITPYVNHNTTIGFITNNFEIGSNSFFLDNVNISQDTCPIPVVTETFTPADDTSISQLSQDTNYSTDPLMQVGDDNANYENRVLVKFDISSIAPGTSVLSANLRLYAESVTGVQNEVVELYRMTADWQEGTATWTLMESLNPYYHAVPLSLPTISWTPGWKEWPVPVELINEWVDGVSPNRGLLLDYPLIGKKNHILYIATKDHADPNLHPQLVIEYQP